MRLHCFSIKQRFLHHPQPTAHHMSGCSLTVSVQYTVHHTTYSAKNCLQTFWSLFYVFLSLFARRNSVYHVQSVSVSINHKPRYMKRSVCGFEDPSGLLRAYGSPRGAQQWQKIVTNKESPSNSHGPHVSSLSVLAVVRYGIARTMCHATFQ